MFGKSKAASLAEHKIQIKNGLKDRPYTLTQPLSNKGYDIVFGIVGIAFIAVPLFILYQFSAVDFSTIVFGIVGSILLAISMNMVFSTNSIIFHADDIETLNKSFFGGQRRIKIPYSEFKGVFIDEFVDHEVNQYGHTINTPYQTITLLHPDHRLNIQLYEAEGATPPRDIWKTFTRELNIPALQPDGGAYNITHQDDIDLSLHDRSSKPSTDDIETNKQDNANESPPSPRR